MKAPLRAALVLWMLGGTWVFAQLWFAHPDALPRFPSTFALWITKIWIRWGLERILDAETVLVYLVCAMVAGSIAGALVRLLRLRR